MGPHLPGPYLLSKFRENSGAVIILGPDPDPEAAEGEVKRLGAVDLTIDVKRGQGWAVKADADPLQMATAKLWVAAPDLLEALMGLRAQTLFDARTDTQAKLDAMKAADIAIAKARGQ
jgi:hypothetical protein